jgi:rhodanese-related sulfurtransferase
MSADYVLLGLVIAYFAWRILSSFLAPRKIPALLRDGAQVVDVRTPGEFAAGHAPGSLNIPLQDLAEGAKVLDPNRWVIVCCASGTRSGIARRKLRGRGFSRVLNAGSWRNLP